MIYCNLTKTWVETEFIAWKWCATYWMHDNFLYHRLLEGNVAFLQSCCLRGSRHFTICSEVHINTGTIHPDCEMRSGGAPPHIVFPFTAEHLIMLFTSLCATCYLPYAWCISSRNRNASARRLEPRTSPRAVSIGIDELSGSTLKRHIKWIRTWAMYSKIITYNRNLKNINIWKF